MAIWRLWDVGVLGAVDDDVLGHDPALQHALLGVLSAPSEKSGGFNAKVSNLLGVTVDRAEAVLLLDLLVPLLKKKSAKLAYIHSLPLLFRKDKTSLGVSRIGVATPRDDCSMSIHKK